MSADNYVLVKEVKPGYFKIYELMSECYPYDAEEEAGIIRSAKGLREAIKVATDLVREFEVEYGIEFDLLPQKQTSNSTS